MALTSLLWDTVGRDVTWSHLLPASVALVSGLVNHR